MPMQPSPRGETVRPVRPRGRVEYVTIMKYAWRTGPGQSFFNQSRIAKSKESDQIEALRETAICIHPFCSWRSRSPPIAFHDKPRNVLASLLSRAPFEQ